MGPWVLFCNAGVHSMNEMMNIPLLATSSLRLNINVRFFVSIHFDYLFYSTYSRLQLALLARLPNSPLPPLPMCLRIQTPEFPSHASSSAASSTARYITRPCFPALLILELEVHPQRLFLASEQIPMPSSVCAPSLPSFISSSPSKFPSAALAISLPTEPMSIWGSIELTSTRSVQP